MACDALLERGAVDLCGPAEGARTLPPRGQVGKAGILATRLGAPASIEFIPC